MPPEPDDGKAFDALTRIDDQLERLNNLMEKQVQLNQSLVQIFDGDSSGIFNGGSRPPQNGNGDVVVEPPDLRGPSNPGDLLSTLAVRDGWTYSTISINKSGLNGGNTVNIYDKGDFPGVLMSLYVEVSGDANASDSEVTVSSAGYTYYETIQSQFDDGITARTDGIMPYVPRFDDTDNIYAIAFEPDNGIHWSQRMNISVNIPNSVNTADVVVNGYVIEIENVDKFLGGR